MTLEQKIIRDDTITEALRAVDRAVGNEPPTQQTLRIIAELKRLRLPEQIRANPPADYLSAAQQKARAAWAAQEQIGDGPEYAAVDSVKTPLGLLTCRTWRQRWSGKRGVRAAWCSEYWLDGQPITIAEIRMAGLAERARKRRRKIFSVC